MCGLKTGRWCMWMQAEDVPQLSSPFEESKVGNLPSGEALCSTPFSTISIFKQNGEKNNNNKTPSHTQKSWSELFTEINSFNSRCTPLQYRMEGIFLSGTPYFMRPSS